jgi:hypothetical protein
MDDIRVWNKLFAGDNYRKPFAAFRAPSFQDIASARSAHAMAETMLSRSFPSFRLPCTFHREIT